MEVPALQEYTLAWVWNSLQSNVIASSSLPIFRRHSSAILSIPGNIIYTQAHLRNKEKMGAEIQSTDHIDFLVSK